jgi:hypothetical protein
MLVLTVTTDVQSPGTFPVRCMFTSSTDKPLGPLGFKEVIITCLLSGKTFIKLYFVLWEVFSNHKIGHNWSPSMVVVYTSITDDLVRCGQSHDSFSTGELWISRKIYTTQSATVRIYWIFM